jgi:hypothetical protein
MKHVVRLSKTFSDIIIHDGIPELGEIVTEKGTVVTWMFNEREMYAVLSDAVSIQESHKAETCAYSDSQRSAAKTAETTLRNVINAKSIPVQVP